MAIDGNKKEPLIWVVHPDGLRVYSKGVLVGVIPLDEFHHLVAELAHSMRFKFGKGAQKKDPAEQGQV